MLAGIAQHPVTRSWAFKGGTCLRKCWFETYRFSEDLDFTVPEEDIDTSRLESAFDEIAEWVNSECGLRLVTDGGSFRLRKNKRGNPTIEGRIAYIGPLGMPTPAKVKLDLTADEMVVRDLELRPVAHPFGGGRTNGASQQVAEVFGWLGGSRPVPILDPYPVGDATPDWRPSRHMTTWQSRSPTELIRFAGANRLRVTIDYVASEGRIGPRTVEPYSLRRSQDGSLLLFVVNDLGQLRSYRVDRIRGVSVESQTFAPRYIVEF